MDITYTRLLTIVLSLFSGVLLIVIARKMKIPAIAPLLIGGLFLGPEFSGLVQTESLNGALKFIISLSVATILFEGGLTLNLKGFKKGGRVIVNLLTIGVLVTWFGTTLAILTFFDFSIEFSLLAGSLVIVTGPTVITPLLQKVSVKEKLHQILHWEGILIDPIGVFIAILCFEWFSIEGSAVMHLSQFLLRLAIGVGIGLAGGYTLYYLLKNKVIPDQQVNIFVLTFALLLFGISDLIVHEAGILTVVVAGFILGIKEPEQLKRIHQFKSELTDLAIGVLFVLLSANLKIENFTNLGMNGLFVVFAVLFLVRPISIFCSSIKTELKLKDKLFLSWVAPRGVVAGSMASLFSLQLADLGIPEAQFLEAFTFSIIGATILIQGVLTDPVAKILKVKAPPKKGWLIIGAHTFSQKLADFIRSFNDTKVYLLDTNEVAVKQSTDRGYSAYVGNALSTNSLPDNVISEVGNLISLTDNKELNKLICERWSGVINKKNLYRWSGSKEKIMDNKKNIGTTVFNELDKPSKITYDLNVKESILIRSKIEHSESKMVEGSSFLISRENNKFVFDSMNTEAEGDVLLYQKIAHHLPFYIHPEHIVELDVNNYDDLLKESVKFAVKTHPELNYNEIVKRLLELEKSNPTVLGNGVATPHVKSESVSESICLIVKVKKGLDLNAYDNKQSKLFFVLISPQNDPEMHLILLSDIAKITADTNLIEKIIDEDSFANIFNLLTHFRS